MDDLPDLGRSSRGPRIVATTFKVLAVIEVVGGSLGALITGLDLGHNSSLSTSGVVGTAAGIEVGAIVVAATLAFFGYVLELLTDMRDDSEIATDLALTPDD